MWKFPVFNVILKMTVMIMSHTYTASVGADQSCDRQIQARKGSTGVINSPGYPNLYPGGSSCTYRVLSSSPSNHVMLTFLSFSLESHQQCEFDYVAVYDGPTTSSNLLGKFCGKSLPRAITSSGQYLTIVFKTDTTVHDDGFSIRYTVGCSYMYTDNHGQIASPNFPSNYPDASDCTYNIQPVGGSQILLEFTNFDIEESADCSFDYLTINDGSNDNKSAMKSLCGLKTDLKMLVNSSRLALRFHSDQSVSRSGFQLTYRVSDGCDDLRGGCEQNCHVIHPGKIYCSCSTGFELDSNGLTCNDIDECRNNNPCSDQCTNTIGHYECSCSVKGFQLSPDGHTCTDMTCSQNNGGCEQLCQSAGPAQYHCACHSGYRLAADSHNCTDINECDSEDPNYGHRCEQKCVNEPGSYYCNCMHGYTLSANGRTCDDVNECPEHEEECSQRCVNTPGSWQCGCYDGYVVDPTDSEECIDSDECAEGAHPASCTSCYNFEGSYSCTCAEGFEPNDDSTDCLDVDECAADNGGCKQLCLNTDGSYRCGCQVGYEPTEVNSTDCKDINECAPNNGNGPCSHYCENEIGSFNCICLSGWRLLDSGITCQDIDECEEAKGNDKGLCSQQCVNTAGSYTCSCFPGYASNTDGTCEDINECSRDNVCSSHPDSECTNTVGSYTCSCPAGYVLTNTTHCEDVDECAEGKHDCQQLCDNTPGSYSCQCRQGFQRVGASDCVDVNECLNSPCAQSCVNEVGSFRCECSAGYYLTGDGLGCTDINECEEAHDNCEQICVNEVGYHRCACRPGFTLRRDNTTCKDINECESGIAGCSHHCLNSEGSFWCYCDTNFKLGTDNKTCEDIDECLRNNGGCQHFCTNLNGSYTCDCQPGYTFNGTYSCADIDECSIANGNCSQTCVNHPGSFECTCAANYRLADDNRNCELCPTCDQFTQLRSDVNQLQAMQATVRELVDNNRRMSAAISALQERLNGLNDSTI